MSSSSSDSPVAHAVSTDVVLLHIFQYLRVDDLLTCRVVNQKWNVVASVALGSRHVCIKNSRLRHCGMIMRPSNYVDTYHQDFDEDLKFLADRMNKNLNFRFLGLVLDDFLIGDGPREKSFQTFAKSCGKYIRRLHIESWNKTAKLPQIFAWFKETEYISVGNIGRIPPNRGGQDAKLLRLRGKDIILTKLRCLKVVQPSDVNHPKPNCGTKQLCEELIRASPALKRIENFPISLTDIAIEFGKLNAVSELDLHSNGTCSPDLKTFSENSPQLKRFAFSGFYKWAHPDTLDDDDDDDDDDQENEQDDHQDLRNSTLDCLNRILTASKDTLRHLLMDHVEKPPVLTKLRSLHIVDRRKDCHRREGGKPYRIFPTSWEYSPRSYFPVLQTVRLELHSFKGDSVQVYFGDFADDTLPTVTTLELACPFDDAGIAALADTFPNVDTLRVFWDKCTCAWDRRSSASVSNLWLFSLTLKTLEIHNFRVDSENFKELDSSLTGFSVEISENLRKRHRISCNVDDLDAFRTNTSITRLKGLERFSIHFICETYYQEEVVPDSRISPISHWYAFDLMPNLKVQFLYDLKGGTRAKIIAKALEAYKPYVSILAA